MVRRKKFTRVKSYVRNSLNGKPHKVKSYRRTLPPQMVASMQELAKSQKEYGGEVDFLPDGGYRMSMQEGKEGEIDLNPTPHVEAIVHTHPICDADGNIIPEEAALQPTPSPADIIIMLHKKDDENWFLPLANDFIVYKETDDSVKDSAAVRRSLQADYDRLEQQSFEKYPIKTPSKGMKARKMQLNKQNLKQTQWQSKQWEMTLKKKYGIYIKHHRHGEPVIVTGKHLR